MVKNTKGGGGAKKGARKHTNDSQRAQNKLRISNEVSEIYAQVEKLLGNGMCYVNCMDTKKRICVIRGKFRGRGKRDNTLVNGTWCLIGLRDYLSEPIAGDLEKSDLLEVYSETDKPRLRSQVSNVDWNKFLTTDSTNSFSEFDTNLEFTDDRQEDYKRLMEQQIKAGSSGKLILNTVEENDSSEGEKEIDIDDI